MKSFSPPSLSAREKRTTRAVYLRTTLRRGCRRWNFVGGWRRKVRCTKREMSSFRIFRMGANNFLSSFDYWRCALPQFLIPLIT